MTTDKTCSNKLLKDLLSVPSPVFYVFSAVAVFCGLYVLGLTPIGIITTIFLVLLVACASADIKSGIIPDLILIMIVILCGIKFHIVATITVANLMDSIIGALCISVPMLLVTMAIKGAFGGGDIKLMAAAGLFLGWRLTVVGAVIGMFVAGVYAIYLLAARKTQIKSNLCLGPFLVYGLAIVSLYGEQLVNRTLIVAEMC